MKKLMILGGSRYALPVIKSAHELGLYVITADYLPGNIAHKFSDEYCNVSIVEHESVLREAERLQVDGITSFACDPGVITAAYVAEQLGLPSPGPYESICILQNKGRFRRFLKDNGFNTPLAFSFCDVTEALNMTNRFKWPVIVKPTDSAGSKGVKKVEDPRLLKTAIEYALSYSKSGEFIIEEFITQKGYSSDTDSFSVDGEMRFVSFNSQMFDKEAENPYTPAAYSWPSSISAENQTILASELQRLIKLLEMRTSIYNIETRESVDGIPYIMECSPRGGGNRLAECLEHATGVKLVENSVRASMGMEIVGVEQKPYDGYWAEVVLHSEKDGVFKDLWISEDIKSCIVEKDLWVNKGSDIKSFSSANFAVGTLILKFKNDTSLRTVMENLDQFVRIKLL